ncbi:unnamed protein product [Timema podura]|uniref:Uncharacterized protein n=1 Tax=Timema podura TaxID=61482 RepID=A0ABN7NYM5_TIMPD|nr:unnamed protein product [Timema podura]
MERERGNKLGKTTLKTPYRDSRLDLPVISSLLYCGSTALDYAPTEAGYKSTLAEVNGFENIINIMKIGLRVTQLALESNEVQKLINDEHQHFDLVFILSALNEAFYGFAHKFNASIISICPNVGFPWSLDSVELNDEFGGYFGFEQSEGLQCYLPKYEAAAVNCVGCENSFISSYVFSSESYESPPKIRQTLPLI